MNKEIIDSNVSQLGLMVSPLPANPAHSSACSDPGPGKDAGDRVARPAAEPQV